MNAPNEDERLMALMDTMRKDAQTRTITTKEKLEDQLLNYTPDPPDSEHIGSADHVIEAILDRAQGQPLPDFDPTEVREATMTPEQLAAVTLPEMTKAEQRRVDKMMRRRGYRPTEVPPAIAIALQVRKEAKEVAEKTGQPFDEVIATMWAGALKHGADPALIEAAKTVQLGDAETPDRPLSRAEKRRRERESKVYARDVNGSLRALKV